MYIIQFAWNTSFTLGGYATNFMLSVFACICQRLPVLVKIGTKKAPYMNTYLYVGMSPITNEVQEVRYLAIYETSTTMLERESQRER
jgi:hypothetical protein